MRSINAIILFSLSFVCLVGTVCRAQGPKNQSQLAVSFAVRKGKLSIDRGLTKPFTRSATFDNLIADTPAKAEAETKRINLVLLDDLDKVLAKNAQIYWYALSNDEKTLDANGQLMDDATTRLRTYTGSWADYKGVFTAWASAGPNRFGLQQALSALFSDSSFADNLANTALILFDLDDTTGLPNYDADSGTAHLQVGDPVKSWAQKSDYVICLPLDINDHCTAGETAPESDRVRKVLGSLPNHLWRPIAIKASIEDYYAQKGDLPTVNLSGAADDPKWINIQRSPRLGRILLPAADVDDGTIARILYLLLPDKDFRFFVRSKASLIQTQTITIPSTTEGQPAKEIKFKFVDYLSLGEHRTIGNEPFLNQFQLQNQQLQLSQIGFIVSQRPAGGRPERDGKSYLDLDVLKMASAGSASSEKPDSAPRSAGATTSKGFVDSRPQKPELQNAPLPTSPSVPDKPPLSQTAPRERNNYLGGGFDYRPGQGVRPLAFYQRSHVGPGNLALEVGSQGSGLGSLSYVADFALFGNNFLGGKFFRRLSVQFTGSTDFESNRLFSGIKTDERRTGGLAQADLELFRDLHGHMLRLSLAGRRTTVELLQNDKTVGKQNLTVVDLGGFYLFQGDQLHYPRSLRVEPRVRLGVRLGASEPRFLALSLAANFHQKLTGLMEADINGHLEKDSLHTPVYEQASFGGAEVVRGFRRDDAIGRSLWSLQNELWLPVPGTRGATDGPAFFLRRNVRLAGFADVGGVYSTTGSKPGIRFGPGVGARVIYNLVVLKIDWAYGLGDAATGRSHGRFYFGVSFNRPF